MSQKLFAPLALVVGLIVLAPSAVQAGGPGYGYGGYGNGVWPGATLGGVTGFGVSGSLYGLGQIPVPPYFSLHPPVYYSQPVPRTYGYSPFPYSGNIRTPEIAISPEEIINPHAAPKAEEPLPKTPASPAAVTTAAHRRSTPLIVNNPYCQFDENGNFVRVAMNRR